MSDENEIRSARERMESAKQQSEKTFGDSQRLPRRFRIYDRIKENVSLGTINGVIIVTSVLIIALLIYGIVTGNPTG